MSTKTLSVLAATLILALSGTAFAESASKLEKAHEKAEADVQSMDAKKSEKLEKAHEKAEAHLEKIEAK